MSKSTLNKNMRANQNNNKAAIGLVAQKINLKVDTLNKKSANIK